MSEYTPTTGMVRFGFSASDNTATSEELSAQFERWLADHDEQVRAAERERCAQIAKSMIDDEPDEDPDGYYGQACIEVAAAIEAASVEPQQKEGNTYFDTLRDLDPGGTMTEIIDASEARVAQQKEGQS